MLFRYENVSSYLVWTPRTGRNLACRVSVCSFGRLRSDRKMESSTVKGTWTVGIRIFWNSDLIHWPGFRSRSQKPRGVVHDSTNMATFINIKPSLFIYLFYPLNPFITFECMDTYYYYFNFLQSFYLIISSSPASTT